MRMRTHYGPYARGETVEPGDEDALREQVPELIYEGEGPAPPIIPEAVKAKRKTTSKSKASEKKK